MNIYLIYLSIIVLTIIFFILIKDKLKALRLTGCLTISSSILLIVTSFIIKIMLANNVTTINISNYIFVKFINTSVVLFTLGMIEILISKYINNKKIKE